MRVVIVTLFMSEALSLQERPSMDLFKAIFAESSSSESSDSETETQPEESSLPLEAKVAASGKEEAGLHQAKQRKTRWQDLSVVTNNPLPVISTSDMHKVEPNTAEELAGTLRGVAAVDRGVVGNGDRRLEGMASLDNKPKEVFGPILPPGK